MQTTLLGISLTIIGVLLAALVGPFFIDWDQYRPVFEREAARLIGAPVGIGGAIEARLLPTPSLLLRSVDVGPPGKPYLHAGTLRIELALGPLLRGQLRASEVRLGAPRLALGLDAQGKLALPPLAARFDADQASIDRLAIDNGRIVLADAGTGSEVTLDKVSFRGELRSLAGPFKGEGGFVSSGVLYGYRLAGRGSEGETKLRVTVDTVDAIERPLSLETEGALRLEAGAPRYEGTVSLVRAAPAAPQGANAANEPWRLTSRVRVGARDALMEQLELHYGPDDRAVRLIGTVGVNFRPRLRLDAVFSARQLDLDRLSGLPEGPERLPVAVVRTVLERFVGGFLPPMPVQLGVDVDALTIAGAPVQSVRLDARSEGDTWNLDTLEFRAPGLTQVQASGRLKLAGRSVAFSGPVSVGSGDPRMLSAWLDGKADASPSPPGPLQVRGELTLGSERVAIENLRAEFDRKSFAGRLAYAFGGDRQRPRLDAALRVDDIDVERALAFIRTALGGTSFKAPEEVALELAAGRASYAGIEANGVAANLVFDANGLKIDRLAVADVRGARLEASGRIDTTSASPQGSIALAVEAQRLDGVSDAVARFAPEVGRALQRYAAQLAPAKLDARLDVTPAAAGGPDKHSTAKISIRGSVGPVRLAIAADATGDAGAPEAATAHLDGRLEADDGGLLAAIAGVDKLLSVDKRPARLSLVADKPSAGDIRVDGRLTAGGAEASAAGSIRITDGQLAGDVDLAMTAAAVKVAPRDDLIPIELRAHGGFAGGTIEVKDLAGKIAGSAVDGRFKVALGAPIRLTGRIETAEVDAVPLLSVGLGWPGQATARKRASAWSAEPFAPGVLDNLDGQVDFAAGRAVFAPALAVRDLRGTVRFDASGIAFENVEGVLAGGRFTAGAGFRAAPAGRWGRARVALSGADVAALIGASGGAPPVAGRVSFDAEFEGAGLSPAALVGSLNGGGTVNLADVRVSRLDPQAVDATLQAAERGMPIERMGDFATKALDRDGVTIAAGAGVIAIGEGRAKLAPLEAPVAGGDLRLAGHLDLVEDAIDARLTLTRSVEDEKGRRPDISVTLKGPIAAPRRAVDAAMLVNWVMLHTIERESQRVEAAQRENERLAAEAARRAEQARAERERAERQRAEAERQRAEAERANAARANAAAANGAPALEQQPERWQRAPELPPPIDIKPAPTPPAAPAAKPDRPPAAVPALIAPLH